MKPIYLFMLISTTVLFAGCGGGGGGTSDDDPKPSVKIEGQSQFEINANGGKCSFSFSSAAGWSIQLPAELSSWITVSPTLGGAGSATVSATVVANPYSSVRTARIEIRSGTVRQSVSITQ